MHPALSFSVVFFPIKDNDINSRSIDHLFNGGDARTPNCINSIFISQLLYLRGDLGTLKIAQFFVTPGSEMVY